jgi:cell division protein FtsW
LLLLLPVSAGAFFLLVKSSPYRAKRFLAFMDPKSDPSGIAYHVNQILISLSNGGLLGRGFGSSRQKYLFLPEAHTDSIFAIIGEEVGFIGSVLLIFALFVLLYKIYEVVIHAPDRFGRLLAGGILGYFGLQIAINLGGMVSLFPLTGVPLPFFSYGGSNLLISFAFMGILLNIARK